MRNFSESGYRFSNDNVIRFLVEEMKTINDSALIEEMNFFIRLAKSKMVSRKALNVWVYDVKSLPESAFQGEHGSHYTAKRTVISMLNG